MSSVTTNRPTGPRPGAGRNPSKPLSGGGPPIDPFRVLRRHMTLIILSAFFGVILGGATWFALDRFVPRYATQVLYEVRPGLREARDIMPMDDGANERVERLARTETVLMTSRAVITEAMKSRDILNTKWSLKFMQDGQFSVDDAVDELVDDVYPVMLRNTSLFGIGWSAPHADDVPIVLNRIAEAYNKRRSEADNALYSDNLKVFNNNLDRTSSELKDLNLEIAAFIKEKGITVLDDPRFHQVSLAVIEIMQRRSAAEAQLSLLRTLYAQTAAKLEGTMEPNEEDRLEAEVRSEMRLLVQRLVDQSTNLRLLRKTRTDPQDPQVVQMENFLRATEEERDFKMQEIIRQNLQAKLRETASRMEGLRQMMDELAEEYEKKDRNLREVSADIASYLALEQRRKLLEEAREADQQMIKELQLMRFRADASRVRQAQAPETPRTKSFPKIELIVPLVAILTIGLTVMGIFVRELTDQRVKSASDLSVVPGARILGVIPELEEDPTRGVAEAELVVRKHPTSVLSESYRQATGQLIKAMERSDHRTLLLMSGLPGSGSTTAVSNIAAVNAAAGKRVLVVDANFRRSRLAAIAGVAPDSPGLGDILGGDVRPASTIQSSESGFDIITAGTPANRVFERLSNGRFESLMAELRDQYDLILIDAPPAVVAGDALLLANKVDAAAIIVRANKEQRGLVARLIHQVSDARCELLGVILNRPRGTAGGYFKKNFATMAEYAKA